MTSQQKRTGGYRCFLASGVSKIAEFSAEWMVNKEGQPAQTKWDSTILHRLKKIREA